MSSFHLAQLNIAHAIAPLDDPRLAEFAAAIPAINHLAESSPGFIWRLKESGFRTIDGQIQADHKLLINISLWQSIDALFAFAYQSAHATIMARRHEWFKNPSEFYYQVLWWVPTGHFPTANEAWERLDHLNGLGPTAHAFTFKQNFPPPSAPANRIVAGHLPLNPELPKF